MSHVKNVAAFEEFVGYCSGYGGSYNPGLPNLKVSALQELAVKARKALDEVTVAKSALNNATNSREIAFADVPRLASSILFTMASLGASEQALKDARVFLRLLTSRTRTRQPVPSEQAVAIRKENHGQRGFTSMVYHLERLVQTASDEPVYKPNEPGLTPEGLRNTTAALAKLNAEVSAAKVAWNNARVAMHSIYYGEQSLLETGRNGKKYLRAIYGLNSNEYAQVKKIKFTKVKM